MIFEVFFVAMLNGDPFMETSINSQNFADLEHCVEVHSDEDFLEDLSKSVTRQLERSSRKSGVKVEFQFVKCQEVVYNNVIEEKNWKAN